MNKKFLFLFFAILLISLGLVSAGCCEKTTSGLFCQNVVESECENNFAFAPTSCDTTTFCKKGTCIKNGICSPNIAKISCDEEGGVWHDQNFLTLEICQPGCCLYGDQSAFVSQAECKDIAKRYSVRTYFDYGTRNQEDCYALANNQEEGACVISSDYQKVCLRKTKMECLELKNKNTNYWEDILDFYSSSISINFFPGFLCTAGELGADNAPTRNTMCYRDKVYFVDSLGQRANVFDSKQYDNIDYWTTIQEPSCDIVTEESTTCGNCDYGYGTMCGAKDGKNTCMDLSCTYKGIKYKHGESWCAETDGTYYHIPMSLEVGDSVWNELTSIEGVSELYNIPGSEYVKLECRNGVVIPTNCKGYRNEICMEDVIETSAGDYKYASCIANNYRLCFTIGNKAECEDLSSGNFCKWIPGYRFDKANNLSNRDAPELDVILAKDSEIQGSCLPLFSPGFAFWESDENANLGAINEIVFYETWWLGGDRENLPIDSKVASQRCFSENCYVVPNYGDKITEKEWIEIWNGEDSGKKIDIGSFEYLSQRKGAYCHDKDDSDSSKVGGFVNQPDCISSKNHPNEKIHQPPIFITHQDWITNILLVARSLGDIGHKKSISGEWGDPQVERVISQLVMVKQDMETIKGDMTGEFVMYEGGIYTDKNKRMMEWIGKLFYELAKNQGTGLIKKP